MRKISLLLMFCIVLSSCGVSFKSATSKSRDFPDQVLGDFKYIAADVSGRKEWELRASEAKMFNTKSEIYLYNMAMTFFNYDGTVKSFLSANNGYINTENMNVYSEGKVKIFSENRSILEANKVNWDNSKKLFFSVPEEMVILKRENSVVRGYNMIADTELKEVTLDNTKGNIRK